MANLPTHRVNLMKAGSKLPQIYWEVFVIADDYETPLFAELFTRAGCSKASSIESADLVVFGGGEDVDPILYGETKHNNTRFSAKRDEADMKAYQICLDNGIPMVGVCRGAQFLHVMNGGKLFQHVDNHNHAHQIFDIRRSRIVANVSSVHHQLCRPNPEGGMEIIADASKSTVRWLNDTDKETGQNKDVEAFFYRDTCCFGVQGHPEYREHHEFAKWFFETIETLIVHNPDIVLLEQREGGPKYARMKPDLLVERQALLNERKLKELM